DRRVGARARRRPDRDGVPPAPALGAARRRLGAEQPLLLGGELLFGQDSLLAQLGQLFELLGRVRRRRLLVWFGPGSVGVGALAGNRAAARDPTRSEHDRRLPVRSSERA